MKIDNGNYFEVIKSIDLNSLPPELKEGHDFVVDATREGKTWKMYEDEQIKSVINAYFNALAKFTNKKPVLSKADLKHVSQRTKEAPVKQGKEKADNSKLKLVERIPEELRFIRRYMNLNGKSKTKDQILSFINSLQKAILEKRIRKSSIFAKEIETIQNALIKGYYNMTRSAVFEISESALNRYRELVGSEKVFSSIPFIKRYIGLNEKAGVKAKAAALLEQIIKAEDNGKLNHSDPYRNHLLRIKKNLQLFVSDRSVKSIHIEKNELNGLEGILGCACTPSLNGIDEVENEFAEATKANSDEPQIMNSMDFANVKFVTIGFTGKWFDLIGNPTPGFTAMVYGKPKKGKSYLCVEFAGYLARHHGKVLYVAKEEGLDATLQIKTKDKDVAHPNLTISDGLPKDLSQYGYVFLDSVTKMRLTPEDLERLEKENPGKSFIYIFQTTKQGLFKGANSFQHEVDVVIEVPEKGIAIQNGRFNQGGQINIFNGLSSSKKSA